jgi:hypothetical protein
VYDRARALDVVERALERDPFCPACGASTTIIDQDGDLVLCCVSTIEPRGVMARINAVLMPHIRRTVLDVREGIAA